MCPDCEAKTEKDMAQMSLTVGLGATRPGVYRHHKGGLYTLYSTSIEESSLTPVVHYYSHAKATRWTRTLANFFEMLPGDNPRFVRLRDVTSGELLAAFGYDEALREVSP